MLFLLLLSYSFNHYPAIARPLLELDISPAISSVIDDVLSTRSDSERPETRSLKSILWSCFATIFACTWASVHPNIPDKSAGRVRSFLRRATIMFYAFLVPEAVIAWAIRQRINAAKIAKQYKGKVKNPKEWTNTHGFFLQMGGFVLYKNGKPAYTILPPRFKELIDNDEIDFPAVHEDDIADRSKGDVLSKAIVLMQTTWFVVQCITRWVLKLGMAELEIVTLALAVLNGITYSLWWSKPLDVRWHVRVDWKCDKDRSVERIETIRPVLLTGSHDDVVMNPFLTTASGSVAALPVTLPHNRFFSRILYVIYHSQVVLRHGLARVHESSFARNYHRRAKKHDVFGTMVRYLTVYPFQAIMMPILHMMSSPSSIPDEPASAPTFYAPTGEFDDGAVIGGILVGPMFGAVHCVAWSFEFLTRTEQTLWRISALVITTVPVAFVGGLAGMRLLDQVAVPRWIENSTMRATLEALKSSVVLFGVFISFASLIVYIGARIVLLVLALISLRNLSPHILSQINWITLIPHI